MTSKVQSYDLRDSHEYKGILELEKILQGAKNLDSDDLNHSLQTIEAKKNWNNLLPRFSRSGTGLGVRRHALSNCSKKLADNLSK